MKLLLIDTAFESCLVGLSMDGELKQRFTLEPRAHAEHLLPWVQALLDEAGTGLNALDGIAFGRGPGGFTSLRLGISTVQGLAWGADLGVIPVSSLQLVAQSAALGEGEQALVAMDARMGEVYTGRFAADKGLMTAHGVEAVCAPEAVETGSWGTFTGVGTGFERYAPLQHLPGLAATKPECWPNARAMLQLAEAWLGEHQALAAELAQPVYIRDKVAKKPGEP